MTKDVHIMNQKTYTTSIILNNLNKSATIITSLRNILSYKYKCFESRLRPPNNGSKSNYISTNQSQHLKKNVPPFIYLFHFLLYTQIQVQLRTSSFLMSVKIHNDLFEVIGLYNSSK